MMVQDLYIIKKLEVIVMSFWGTHGKISANVVFRLFLFLTF